jgi:putative FmdB family regulatory protein
VEKRTNTLLVSLNMPNYNYRCLKCDKTEERFVSISQRDDSQTCSCEESGEMKRMISNPSLSHDMINPIKRAGSGWNDVLKRISKNSGKNNIEHY